MTPASRGEILAGLIGAGIQASRSPRLHEREGEAQGLRYSYKLFDLDVLGLTADALPDLLREAERQDFSGLNVTYPCKQAVLAHLDELSADAAAIGAVNTVVFRDGRRIGHNTDWSGFALAMQRSLGDAARRRVVLVGAGGAGAAVAHALLTLKTAQLLIVDVEHDRAAALAAALCARFGSARALASGDVAMALRDADGVVNATPVGMEKLPGMPVPAQLLSPDVWVADVVYFPLETELLREARARGCRTMDGGDMAVFQAAEAFRLFSGHEADIERMLRHFRSM
jgi:shikimate dehydrogenase